MARPAAFLLQLLQLLSGGQAAVVFGFGGGGNINRRFFLASSPQSSAAASFVTLVTPFNFFQFASARALAREHSEFASSDDEFLYYEHDGDEEGADEAPFEDDHEQHDEDHLHAHLEVTSSAGFVSTTPGDQEHVQSKEKGKADNYYPKYFRAKEKSSGRSAGSPSSPSSSTLELDVAEAEKLAKLEREEEERQHQLRVAGSLLNRTRDAKDAFLGAINRTKEAAARRFNETKEKFHNLMGRRSAAGTNETAAGQEGADTGGGDNNQHDAATSGGTNKPNGAVAATGSSSPATDAAGRENANAAGGPGGEHQHAAVRDDIDEESSEESKKGSENRMRQLEKYGRKIRNEKNNGGTNQ
ncbi:unnamed protein product, partial [Amoebophrya sp. A120]|eukprot:GSA120T00013527001.1